MLFEVVAIDTLRVRMTAGLQQGGAEPMARRERQRLRLVNLELVVQDHRALECGDRQRQIRGAARDLPFEDAGEHAEQASRWMARAVVGGCRRRLGNPFERSEVAARAFGLAAAEL